MTTGPDDGVAPLPDFDVTQAAPYTPQPIVSIGPYRLLERIGEGGMGEVWLAEQARPVQRQVALKVIKAGMDTALVLARFDAERQALALMDHPAIARVFDGGATPQGRPYFVMEFVRGESIMAYATRHKLPLRERIELFMLVCEGVQHAHQKGIIHRDLKPSNVLVTVRDDHPQPKIIDFGVAKAMTQSLTERTLHTEMGALVGTPEYMSPEQAEMGGIDIDTRTDVYSLGVILYELLTDTLPFEAKALREQGLDNLRQTIREVDPPRPSTRVTTAAGSAVTTSYTSVDAVRLSRQLRGDLDWITMNALEKDRKRRYGSASDLAADLRRHLDDLPVLASPPSTTYRMSKFVRRHRLGVAGAAALLAMLLAFGTTMAVQAQRITRERDRANREAQAAKEIADFLVGLFSVSDPSQARGNTVTAREILDQGAKRIDTLSSQPSLQARLQRTLGGVYTSLGLYPLADPLLERALNTERRVLGPDNRETMDTLFAVGELRYYEQRYAEAEAAYREAAQRRRAVLGPDARDTLESDMAVASTCMSQNRFDEAERLFRSALERQRRVLGDEDSLTLNTLNELSVLYYRQGRYAEALPLHERGWHLHQKLLGENAPRTLISQGNLADTLGRLKKYAEAEQLYRAAIGGQERVLGREHPMTQRTIVKLIAMYEAWGKPENVAEWRAKLSESTGKP